MTALQELISEYDLLVRNGPRHDERSRYLMKQAREEQRELIEALQGVLKDHEYPLYCIAFDKADRIRDLLAKHKDPR